SLADRKQWHALLTRYQPGASSRLDCHYYWAHYQTGNKATAFQGAQRLWVVGKSQDKACDPLFKVWKQSNHFNQDIAWQRAQKAMTNSKLQLTRYLERYLADKHKAITTEWRRTYRMPNRLRKLSRYLAFGEQAKPIVIAGFKRLARKDYQSAHQLWPDYERNFNFSPQEKAELFNYVARNMAVNYYPEAEQWLDNAVLYSGQEDLIRYGIRHALRDYDWQRVKQWIAMLPAAERSSAKWRYWEAKAEQVISKFNSPLIQYARYEANTDQTADAIKHITPSEENFFNPLAIHHQFVNGLQHSENFLSLLPDYSLSILKSRRTPNELFESLAQERNFYGFMSSTTNNKPLSLNHTQPDINEENLQHILQHPGIIRSLELYLLNATLDAHREWYAAIKSMPAELRGTAAQVAHYWGWHNQAIVTASRSNIRDHLELRFPKAYSETISSHAQTRGLASDWVYSLIRQESAFSPRAVSGVGALGIMQIMPGTARQVSRSAGIKLTTRQQLLDPQKNIMIGTAYLEQLLNQFDGNLVLATTAYNAGPHRAKRWQPRYKPMDGDIWIETIPIHETRNYVKNILTYQAIYRRNLGLEAKLSDSLKVIQPQHHTSVAAN
ncbi:MAG: hypothetical protein CSA49_00150, partial [Gammaproteobacteria bacterium]